jgi:hypothetical protein
MEPIMKYFVLSGIAALILTVLSVAVPMTYHYVRGRIHAGRVLKMGGSDEAESPEPENEDFTMGFRERMHKYRRQSGAECSCHECEAG